MLVLLRCLSCWRGERDMIGRLAVAKDRVGEVLLVDALQRVFRQRQQVAIDALDEVSLASARRMG